MIKTKTGFEGLYVLKTDCFHDKRGDFLKIFNKEMFALENLEHDFCEFYYSVNNKNVIRGMHFQTPPYDHTKVVYVSKGKILDVVVDIRKKSNTYGKCFSVILQEGKGEYLYIPKGFAHGFLSLQDNTIVNYAQTSCYNREHDCGIAADSIEFDWNTVQAIRSGRDLTFPPLNEFKSPF